MGRSIATKSVTLQSALLYEQVLCLQSHELPIQSPGTFAWTLFAYWMSETVDHNDMIIEATKSNTSGVWVKSSSAHCQQRRAGLLTMMNRFLSTSWLFWSYVKNEIIWFRTNVIAAPNHQSLNGNRHEDRLQMRSGH